MDSSYPQETFLHTTFSPSSFWAPRRSIVRKATLHTQLQILKTTGRYDAFKLKWHPVYSEDGHKSLFWDSDIAKWIEGACYFLIEEYDQEIDFAVKELVDMIGKAQWKDGYLNIYFTVVKPGERWTNVRDLHELYNAGHLIEAALAHCQYYKNSLLLDPILRYVEHIHLKFGPGPEQIHGYPGHPEIELALLRLYSLTSNSSAYELAKYFITERGNQTGCQGKPFYVIEAEKRGDHPGQRTDAWPTTNSFWYQQAHTPILEQESVEGHSVRAMYVLTAVADLVYHSKLISKDEEEGMSVYKTAAERLWNNMVNTKMYITGGIGAVDQWEGFGIPYFLPQSTDEGGCYAETCASIGIMMFAQRMLQLDLDSKYSDILELALYNTVLGSMSQDGKRFMYENHLASCEERLCGREEWFECSCCPPNVLRTFGMLGGYVWDSQIEGKSVVVNVHLYTSATLTLDVGGRRLTVKQDTTWPWGGNVAFMIDAPDDVDVTINVRIPGWAKPFLHGGKFELNPKPKDLLKLREGYLTLPPTYTSLHHNTPIALSLHTSSFAPRLLQPHPRSNQNTLTIARGPLIYCAEDIDNPWHEHRNDHFRSVLVSSKNVKFEECIERNDFLNEEYVKITVDAELDKGIEQGSMQGGFPGLEVIDEGQGEREREKVRLVCVPFFYRGNRGGKGHMRVGFRRSD